MQNIFLQNTGLFISLFFGGLIGWLTTFLYYKKSKRDSQLSENRICHFIGEKAVDQIQASIHKKKDANEVLENIWKYMISKFGDSFMELRCKKCGSDDLSFPYISTDYGEADFILCNKCGNDEF